MTLTYEVGLGQHLDRAIEEMVSLANAEQAEVVATFNDTTLRAIPGDDPVAIASAWQQERARRAEEWRRSPAGLEAAEKRAEAVAQKQRDCDTLVGNLMHIDFTNLKSVLLWLMAFECVADDIDVRKPTGDILHVFESHGYEPGMNTGDDFDADDSVNVAHYIIGQGLDGIRSVGSPHPIIHKFAADWFSGRSSSGE